MFVAGQPMAFWLFAKHNGFAFLAEVLLPLHAQPRGHVMDKHRHVTLQADEGVA
ncbi:hypothetical protein D3C71_2184450 [compost metagenome]